MVTRNLAITYGNITVGGVSSYILHDTYLLSLDYDELDLQFRVLIAESTETLFKARVAALEAEFRKPYQDLSITIGSSTYTYQQSDNTLLDAQPSIQKAAESRANTNLSREYICRVRGGRAADLSGESSGYVGLVSLETQVKTAANGQRTVVISGAYTAQPSSNDAQAQYNSQISDLETAILDGVDASTDWEELDEEKTLDRNDRVMRFTKAFQEIIYPQSQSVDDHPAIKTPSIFVQASQTGIDDSIPNAEKPVEVTVGFLATIDKSQSTDLKTLWLTVIRPHMIQTARDYLTTTVGPIAVMASNPGFDPTSNVIRASLDLLVFTSSPLISATVTTTESVAKPFRLVPLFGQNPYAFYIMPTTGSAVRQTRVDVLVRGFQDQAIAQIEAVAPERPFTPGSFGQGDGALPGTGEAVAPQDVPPIGGRGGGWLEVERTRPETKKVVGIGTDQVDLYRASQIITAVYVVPGNDGAPLLER